MTPFSALKTKLEQGPPSLEELSQSLEAITQEVEQRGKQLFEDWSPKIQRGSFRKSARNLAHYLVLRSGDLRLLQRALMPYGLSSLGRLESRVLPTLKAVLTSLLALQGQPPPSRFGQPDKFFQGLETLHQNTAELFGPQILSAQRTTRIMVTLPSSAADDPAWVRQLVLRGMNLARINCAHDHPESWQAMVAHIRAAAKETGQTVRILMDLGGPKPRTTSVNGKKEIVLKGDRLLLSTQDLSSDDLPPSKVAFQCTIPSIVQQLQLGDTVWIDDGKFGAVVDHTTKAFVTLRVIHAPPDGAKIKTEKGLNFPDSQLTLRSLTPEDLQVLPFALRHADLLGYSYVQQASDIEDLQQEMKRISRSWRRIGLIAKIETPRAIAQLPAMIIAGAGKQPFGVMIARGDLAIEVGYERTAEMQEEILWLCEAAQVPVIWATQVLEQFVKNGQRTRGEMTDAAMSGRAEAVMLNKGPFVAEAVTLLDQLLSRMERHQSKKTSTLRALQAWSETLHPPTT